ncbi:MAG TPA: BatA domain-containing protein [Gemmatimonadaceae bacterium]
MIWRNPWAWLGLATLALPVLIHLLGRGHARVQPFPSLRFLQRSKFLPTRRARLHDGALLLVRLGILAVAVTALAQPLLRASRGRSTASSLARAIIVDTSASMHAGTALEAARRDAQPLAAEAQTALVIESASPARELRGADAWLGRQSGRRELVVLSDFQSGSLTATDLRGVQPATGIRLARVPMSVSNALSEVVARSISGTTVARLTATPTSTAIEWSARSDDTRRDDLLLLAATATDAASRAARAVGVRLPLDTTRAIAIVFPSYARRGELASRVANLDQPWMTDFVARLRSDSLMIESARDATSSDSIGLVVARNAAGRPVVTAAKGDVDGRTRLIFFSATEPTSLTSVALIAAVDRARSVATPLGELEPTTIPDQTLAAWQREPSTTTTSESNDADGRWLWIVVLALIGVETLMRRALPPKTADVEMVHDRAA